MNLDDTAARGLAFLHRGGAWAYFFTLPDRVTRWFPVGKPLPVPSADHVFFGVNPARERKPAGRPGVEDIGAIACLFAEFDAKDFGGKDQARARLDAVDLPASLVIDSGGGYHGYWFLSEAHVITSDADRARAIDAQRRWVDYTGGDKAAKDIARVLRVPGTINHKPQYGPNFPTVTIIRAGFEAYALTVLEDLARSATTPSTALAPQPVRSFTLADDITRAAANLQRLAIHRADDYAAWIEVGLALHPLGSAGLALWLDFSRRSPKFDEQVCVKKWESFSGGSGARLTPASLAHWADQDDPGGAVIITRRNGNDPTPPPPESPDDWHTDEPAAPHPQKGGATPPAGKRPPAPTDDELAQRFLDRNPFIKFGLGKWRLYENGFYRPIADDVVRNAVLEIAIGAKSEGIRPSQRGVSSVTEIARLQTFVPDERWDADQDLIVVTNGTLRPSTKKLLPHSPDHFATGSLPFAYDPAADCPTWRRVIAANIPGAADLYQDFCGYLLTPSTYLETAIWLCGERGSGKSTLILGPQTLLGDRAGVLGLAAIEQSRFALADVVGKTLLLATEQPSLYLKSSHVLNALISGERIVIEGKYKDAVTITPRAKILWAMNDLPSLQSGDGLFRRVRIIKVPPRPETERDPAIKAQIEHEGPGLLNWALTGLARLRARGRFEIPKSVSDAGREFENQNDAIRAFVEERCMVGPEFTTQSEPLYKAYSAWCYATNHRPMSSTKIKPEWARLKFSDYKANGRVWFRGVGLRADEG